MFNFKGAISDIDGELIFVDPDSSDMGFMTQKITPTDSESVKKVNGISPKSILEHDFIHGTFPYIFKIDIEGGEADLFNGNTDWMDKFPLIIIELHDWMLPFSGSSRSFIKAVAKYDFDLVHKGENIFLFNRRILAARG